MSVRQHFLSQRLRFKHLMLIRALAETGSLRKAGKLTGVSQPAASKLLSELERGLNAKLFSRTPLGVTPTEHGMAFIRAAATVLAESDALEVELLGIERGSTSPVRVGLFAVTAAPLVSGAVVRLLTANPLVPVRVEDGTAPALITALEHGQLDCIVGRVAQDLPLPGQAKPRSRLERVTFVVRKDHHLARKKRVRLSDLLEEQWIIPTREALLRERLQAALAASGLALPSAQVESSSFLVNEALMRATGAVWPLPNAIAESLKGNPTVHVLPVFLPIHIPPVALCTRHGPPLRPGLAKFIAAAEAVAPELLGYALPLVRLRDSALQEETR